MVPYLDPSQFWRSNDIEDVLSFVSEQGPFITSNCWGIPPPGYWEDSASSWRALETSQSHTFPPLVLHALREYAGPNSRQINTSVVSPTPDSLQQVIIERIREGFRHSAAPCKRELVTYRGFAAHKNDAPRLPSRHFMSTSWNPYVAIE